VPAVTTVLEKRIEELEEKLRDLAAPEAVSAPTFEGEYTS
jgi:hypothetical protein